MELTAADFSTGTWSRLEKMLQRRLQEHRELNDSPNAPEVLRGQIAEIKYLLALKADAKAQAQSTQSFEVGSEV